MHLAHFIFSRGNVLIFTTHIERRYYRHLYPDFSRIQVENLINNNKWDY